MIPPTIPKRIRIGGGILVNINARKVVRIVPTLVKFMSIGSEITNAAATTIPALTALIPSKEARTER